ncbi:hypothetical protein D3C78_1555760 [compost metagenome]
MALQFTTGIKHGFVLGLDGDDVLAAFRVEIRGAFDGQVVGFGCTGSPDDLARVGVDQLGNFFTGALNGFFGIPAIGVAARCRIAEVLVKPRHHLVHDARIDGCRGRIIKINRAGGHIYNS